MTTVLSLSGVVKTFGPTVALDGLDLEARTGEVHGFLGPNGSGKTVTLRILLGLLRHDSGEVRLFDRDPFADAVSLHRRVAYVPGDVNLWPNLTGGEVIDLLGDLQGSLDRTRRDELLDRFDLDPRRHCRAYSKGNRQKVALVAAFASDAELFILDEPTSGLDPLMETVFQDCVDELVQSGRTVLLSSHILDEVERLCDRVTIIRRGRRVQSGTLDELRHLTRTTITVRADSSLDAATSLDGVHDVRRDGDSTTFAVDADAMPTVVAALGQAGVRDLVSRPPTLEELFLRHYGDELAEAGVARNGNGNGTGHGDSTATGARAPGPGAADES